MTDKTVSISDLEARLIYVIHRELGYKPGEIFTPFKVLKSETDLHTFYGLVEHTFFVRTGREPSRFMLNQSALEAYDAWARRQTNPTPIPDPLTDYRGALKEIRHIIEDHDANCAESNADEVLTEIYQLIEHILDLHETTQE